MFMRLLPVLALLALPTVSAAQFDTSPPVQVFGGFTYLSNSFNGTPGARQPLAGWDASATFPWFHRLRFVVDVSGYQGTNLGASQNVVFILAGGQYERRFGREGLFVKALAGDGRLNQHWGANGALGDSASFTTFLGGGLDTPLSHRLGFRVEGGFQHSDFALLQSVADPVPYRIPGLPNYFGRMSAGLTWTPVAGPAYERGDSEGRKAFRAPVDSELVFEGLGSFGHYHIFAYTWWSYLHVGGLEYDRHSWGKFIGARMDYVAEILPIVFLKQPAHTDSFGDPLAPGFVNVEGLGISPAGLRMMWRDGKRWKPYYLIKGGVIGFTQKALSVDGSYENISLQQSVGIQFALSGRCDLRVAVGDFHFSNAFVVPSNPGIDEMNVNAGLSYHFGKRQTGN
jgi:hypothetical protein